MLVLMGLARMGALIQFIPYPVTTGFTSGIAVVISILQMKDLFGLQISRMPERFLDKIVALFEARGTASLTEFLIGAFTLAFLVIWPKFVKKIPAPLVALLSVTVGSVLLKRYFPSLEIATLGTRFSYEMNGGVGHGIPQAMPHFGLPWNLPGNLSETATAPFSWEMIRLLLPSSFAITMLGRGSSPSFGSRGRWNGSDQA